MTGSVYEIILGLACNIDVVALLLLCIESHAVTITTFAKDRVQQRSTYSNSPLDEYQLKKEKTYFTQGPEFVVIKVNPTGQPLQFDFLYLVHYHSTVLSVFTFTFYVNMCLNPFLSLSLSLSQLDHAVVSGQFTDSRGKATLAASHRQLRGFLIDSKGNTLREMSAPELGRPDKVKNQ